MRAGKLDNTIQIIRDTLVDDGYGNLVPGGETVVTTLRAQIIQATTEEFIRGWGASSETLVIFRTRWAEGFGLADKLRHEGRDFNLLEIKPIGRRRGLELRCRAR